MTSKVAGKTLDFIVIGAQKGGTTALFEYMRTHPEIYIPMEKEAPFFSRDERYEQGWDWYVKNYFPDAPQDALWGTVTPQYMEDYKVPKRIHGMAPGAKLIALLRNPIYRALSHYKMTIRWGEEERAFDEIVDELVKEESAAHARTVRAGRKPGLSCYLTRGEYARILDQFHQFFPEDQMLVLFSDDLEGAPRKTLTSVLEFMGASTDFMPANLGKRYHVAGTKRRIDFVYKLREAALTQRLWELVPEQRRRIGRRLYVKFNHWNTLPAPPTSLAEMSPETVEKMVDYFRPDVDRLRNLLGREVPWPEFR